MPTFPLAWPWLAFVGGLGLIFGSFVTALSYRLPRGESIATGRSKCPHCRTVLGIADLVPVLSWLTTRGRCRHCDAAVSGRYPTIEGATGLLCISAGLVADSWGQLGLLGITAPLLVCLAVVDLEHRRVTNVLVIALLLVMVAWRALPDIEALQLVMGIGLGILTWLSLVLINWGGEAWGRMTVIGPGDAKLIATAAIGLSFWLFVVFTGLVGVIALVFGLVWQAKGRQPEFPLAPSFAIALWVTLLFPHMADRFAG